MRKTWKKLSGKIEKEKRGLTQTLHIAYMKKKLRVVSCSIEYYYFGRREEDCVTKTFSRVTNSMFHKHFKGVWEA